MDAPYGRRAVRLRARCPGRRRRRRGGRPAARNAQVHGSV